MAKKDEINPVRLAHSAARIEFIAIKDEITMMLNKGYSAAGVYMILKKSNKITMAKRTFQKLCQTKIKKTSLKLTNKPLFPSKKREEPPASTGQDDSFGIIKKPEDEVF